MYLRIYAAYLGCWRKYSTHRNMISEKFFTLNENLMCYCLKAYNINEIFTHWPELNNDFYSVR